jgi:hypothetical protein
MSSTKLQSVARKARNVLKKLQPFAASLATLDRRAAAINAVMLALQAALKKSEENDDDFSIELLTELSNAIAKVTSNMTNKEKKAISRILARCSDILTVEAKHEQTDTSTDLKNRSRR